MTILALLLALFVGALLVVGALMVLIATWWLDHLLEGGDSSKDHLWPHS